MRRVPAILIVIFISVPLLSAAFLAVSLSTWTLDRGFYLRILRDTRLYEIPDATSSASWSSTVIEDSGGLQWKSVDRAARVVLTPEYLHSQAVRLVNQVFDSLEGRKPFDLSVDLAPAKAALRGEAGSRFARLLAEDLPVGGSRAGFRVTPRHLPVSRPSTMTVADAAQVIQAGIPTFLSSIPDTIRVGDYPEAALHDTYWGVPRFPILGWLLLSGLILLALGAGSLTAAAFTGGEVVRERLQWYGWPLLVPAAGTLAIGLLVIAGISASWVHWGLASAHLETFGFSAGFVAAVAEAARQVATRVGVGFLATGGIAAGAALGLLAWSWALPKNGGQGNQQANVKKGEPA
jgi:hypothetical protein